MNTFSSLKDLGPRQFARSVCARGAGLMLIVAVTTLAACGGGGGSDGGSGGLVANSAAASPHASLAFMFWGEGLFIYPLMLGYTAYSYHVFKGKVDLTSGHY